MTSVQALVFSKSSGGQINVQIQGAKDLKISNVGTVNGSAGFNVTPETKDSDKVLNFTNYDSEDEFELKSSDVFNNFGLNGYNINADFSNTKQDKNVMANTKDSAITAGIGSYNFLTTKDSQNTFIKGSAKASNYTDEGKGNTIVGTGGNNTYTTTGTSSGATILDGAGDSKFNIGGEYGYYDGADGADAFNFQGEMLVNKTYAYRNVVTGGKGEDTFTGKGAHNVTFGNEGRDHYSVGGDWNLANLGFYESADITTQKGSRYGMIFTQPNYTAPWNANYEWDKAIDGEYYGKNSNYFDLFFKGRGEAASNDLVNKKLEEYEIEKK